MTRALLSVTDKNGLVPFAQKLVELGYELVSTGGTHKVLEAAGLNVIAIDDVTDFQKCWMVVSKHYIPVYMLVC